MGKKYGWKGRSLQKGRPTAASGPERYIKDIKASVLCYPIKDFDEAFKKTSLQE